MSSPIKPTFKTEIIPILMIIISIITGVYFYQNFPDQIAIHWGIDGEPDRWGSGTYQAMFGPAIALVMYLMFLFLPYLDPKRERYQEFAKTYHIFKGMLVSFMVLIFILSGLANLNYPINIGAVIPALVGILFIVIGNYMGKIRYNWFMGIRTPWTLSSENVWNKTHRVGGWLFMLMGLIMIIIPYFPQILIMPLFISAIAITILGSVGYSYWLYREEKK